MSNARITYLYHSGFVVETQNHFMVFDYYLDDVDAGKKRGIDAGVISLSDLPKNKKITVFVSHNHGDHFNPVIFKWKKDRGNIDYVISSDVKTRAKAVRMSPYEHVDVSGLSVDTYGSTDAGVSFAVIADGISIFHAGDFNLWHWIEESTPEEVKFAKRAFLREMENLKDLHFDVAFFPRRPAHGPRIRRGCGAFFAHDASVADRADALRKTDRDGRSVPPQDGILGSALLGAAGARRLLRLRSVADVRIKNQKQNVFVFAAA